MKGDQLNVLAPSGLNMRKVAGTKGKKITKLPYGAKVTVVKDDTKRISFRVMEFKGYYIEGFWVKVKYKNHIGYVFDGYLSKLPAPKKGENLSMKEYLSSTFNKNGAPQNIKKYPKEMGGDECGRTQKYKSGIEYSYNECGEGGGSTNITFPGISRRELYLICKIILNDPENIWLMENGDIHYDQKYGEAGCYYTIGGDHLNATYHNYCGC